MCSLCGCDQEDCHSHEHNHDSDQQHKSVPVETSIMGENERHAQFNNGFFQGRSIKAINMISSPGSGKTTILERTIRALHSKKRFCSVIEGDQQTDNDARRISATGTPVFQINTGKACHLDAHGVRHALKHLDPPSQSLLFIENVGNLICPTEFFLGENKRVVVLSSTEGTDKPAKYPLAFFTSHCVIINKIDLMPYVDFDLDECHRLIRGLNSQVDIFDMSATTGEGFDAWLDWLSR